MPKYVLKEDVEKGLVDPTRSLDQQPEYKLKIEKEAQEKNKNQEEEKKPYNQRPKKERPPRNPRPKFNYKKEDITEETKLPDAPKKALEKPNKEKYNEGLDKLKAQREAIKLERKNLIDEQRSVIRDLTESKKTGRMAITQYSGAMKDKFNTQNQLRKQIRALDDVKRKINAELENLQSRFNELSKPNSHQSYSLQELQYKVQRKEHELTTANLNKRQQTRLYNEINELKRALQKARPSIEIQSQIGKLKDQIDILYKELKPIKHELHIKITEANKIKAELEVIRQQKKSEQGNITEQKTVEQIKQEYDQKIKAVDAKRDKIEDKIDDYIDKHNREIDDYEDQQDLLKYISWVKDQIQRIKERKAQDERRKKEKQEYEKRKLKEKEEYQKRKEERKKYQEEKKAKEEQRKLRLQQQRQAYINRNPNHAQIDLCEVLISYCNNLRPDNKTEEKKEKQAGQIKFGKQWQKQLKSGAQVIASKKSQVDQQAPKKGIKQKKKEEKPEQEGFNHGIQVVNQFQKIQLLPPNNIKQIDEAIKFIQEKIAIYNNPTEQEKAAFREKAAQQFDQRNGFGQDNKDRREYKEKQGEGLKSEEKTEKPKRRQKKELNEQDFPGLN